MVLPTSELLEVGALRDLLAELVRIPSVNPAIAPDEAHGERAVAEFGRGWLEARGIEAWLEEAAPGRPNLVARVRGGEGLTLALCAHIDTVGTAGMDRPFMPRVEADRLYGRGAYDMKGGAAACMAAAVTLAADSFPGTLLVALVADEEHASVGAQAFVERHRADACILTEPSEGQLVLAHKGFVWIEVVTHGRAAHGSRWDLGDSAIARMGRVIVALDRLDRDVLRGRGHELVGPASMHCGLVHGGVGLSTYAPECRLQVERRTLPGESSEAAFEEIVRAVREADPEASVVQGIARAPMRCPSDAAIARAVRDAATEVLGTAPPEVGVQYWMDAAIFDAAGIPTVDFGPSGAGAHETVEWVSLESVARTARVLVGATRRFCAESR
jgi:acetylornithine deacetylase/succinyl-diaminopimelate desuccinylase-like protein